MSERGDELRLMLKRELHYAWRPDVWRERGALDRASKHARAICEHLGLDWKLVGRLLDLYDARGALSDKHAAIAIATLLEAAGVERDG